MTREDWKAVEDKLRWPGASARLRVDGRAVTLQVGRDKMKMVIMVFVDGFLRGAWLDAKMPCPEQAFMCRRERYLWDKKARDAVAKYAKRYGKLEARRVYGDMDKKFVCFSSFFPSVPKVRAHYEKTFKSIEVVTE
jgi:hypothetical protein